MLEDGGPGPLPTCRRGILGVLRRLGSSPARPACEDPVVMEQEERQVKRSRLVVIAVLIVSVAILASTMYVIVSRGEHSTFEKQVSLIE